MFIDRIDAGQQLAATLAQRGYTDKADILVLGIPRGGVVVAAEVARALNAPLDIVVTKKVGAPGNPEYAIGAVNLDGDVISNDAGGNNFTLTSDEKRQLVAATLEEVQNKDRLLREGRAPIELRDKTIILVDDGIATGFTTRAAIAYIRARHPKKVVLAVPVGPKDSLGKLQREVDDLVCLEKPEYFRAVGNFYQIFLQVEDDEVRALLAH